MKRSALLVIAGIWLFPGCQDVEPEEKQATLVSFDFSKSRCGYSWIVRIGTTNYRLSGYNTVVPQELRRNNQPVWLRYTDDPEDENCNFIRLISIRSR